MQVGNAGHAHPPGVKREQLEMFRGLSPEKQGLGCLICAMFACFKLFPLRVGVRVGHAGHAHPPRERPSVAAQGHWYTPEAWN